MRGNTYVLTETLVQIFLMVLLLKVIQSVQIPTTLEYYEGRDVGVNAIISLAQPKEVGYKIFENRVLWIIVNLSCEYF